MRNKKRSSRGTGPASQSVAAAVDSETLLIYGVIPVLESLRSGSGRIRKIAVSENRRDQRTVEILDLAKKTGVPVNRIASRELDSILPDGVNHQGIAAYVRTAEYCDVSDLIEKAKDDPLAMFLILDGIEDPRNLGAIVRTAECAGVTGIFIPERRAVGLTETAVKSSAGAVEHIDIAKVNNQNQLIDELKENDIWVVGAAGEAETDYTEWDFSRRTALVLGSEGKGLHRLTAEKCDILVRIPVEGKIGSLNVSVAAGVLLYEAARQRRSKG